MSYVVGALVRDAVIVARAEAKYDLQSVAPSAHPVCVIMTDNTYAAHDLFQQKIQ